MRTVWAWELYLAKRERERERKMYRREGRVCVREMRGQQFSLRELVAKLRVVALVEEVVRVVG